MNTLRTDFQEAFVKQCHDMGLSAETATELFYTAHICELLTKDANFSEGFCKAAGITPFLQPQNAGEGAAAGSVMGGLGGLALGALSAKFKPLKFLKGSLPKALALGAGAGATAGATLGSLTSTPQPGADPSAPFIPSYARGTSAPGTTAGPRNGDPVDIFSSPGGITPRGGSGGSAGGVPMIQGYVNQVKDINQQLATARKAQADALQNPGLDGSTQANQFRAQIRELEAAKAKILNGSNSAIGNIRRDQGQSIRSIDKNIAENAAALESRTGRASKMDEFFRNHNTDSFSYRMLNKIFGLENRAEKWQSGISNLEAQQKMLQEQRGRVQNLLNPVYDIN